MSVLSKSSSDVNLTGTGINANICKTCIQNYILYMKFGSTCGNYVDTYMVHCLWIMMYKNMGGENDQIEIFNVLSNTSRSQYTCILFCDIHKSMGYCQRENLKTSKEIKFYVNTILESI